MPRPPKISIVTPTFKCARYIRCAIESVLAQGYPNLEHIIVDGDSRDGTVEILREYPHVKWISEPDSGEAQALNKALRMASGEIIGWLNADDFYTPGILGTVAGLIDPAAGRGVVYGKMALVTETDQPIGLRIPVPDITMHRLLRWYQHLHIYQPTLFFAAEVVRAVGEFREDLKYSVDLEYWIRVLLKGYQYHYLDQVLAKMRLARSDGKSAHSYADKDRDWLEACRPAVAGLPAGERVQFWKDYYTHRISKASMYGESPFPPPPDRDAVLGLAVAASDSGVLASASGVLRQAAGQFPKDADLRWYLAESLREGGQAAESARAFALADPPATPPPAPATPAIVCERVPESVVVSAGPARRALVYCHFNPHPPRSGAHQAVTGVLRGLKGLGYEVTFASSDLFTDQAWTEAGIKAFEAALGVKTRVYAAGDADREHVKQASRRSDLWATHTPPGLVEFFRGLCRETKPGLVLVNYAYSEGLISAEERAAAPCLVQMHDLVSLGGAMNALAWSQLGRPPFDLARVSPELLREDFFFKSGLTASPEELKRYGMFDGVITMSESEAALVRDHAPRTAVEVIPVALGPREVANTYAEAPLLVIFTNAFNVQGYLYFAREILPRLRKLAPGAGLRVAGDACRVVPAVDGVELLGFVPDISAAYAASKYAICPLIGGTGQQVKIVEAMAHGLAVVVLRNVASSSPVRHGVNGFVAANAQEFAQYMALLEGDRALCRSMGEAARATVANELSEAVCTRRLGELITAAEAARQCRLAALVEKAPEAAPAVAAEDSGLFVMVSEAEAGWGAGPLDPADLTRLARRAYDFLSGFGPFYAHFGGAGDALLLLSSFYDDQPESVVVSYANNVESARSLFGAFPRLRKVYFLPKSQDWQMHALLRGVAGCLPNCLGLGASPKGEYFEEWTERLNIFKDYGVRQFPEWAAGWRNPGPERWVAVAPKGSSMGTIGSKRLLIPVRYWADLIAHLQARGCVPVILGLPAEAAEYPVLPGCVDARSESFPRQMEWIGRCRALVGADSWAKSFSAMLDLPTVVFEATKGAEYQGRKDISDYVFLDPWDAITVVQSLDQFKQVFDQRLGFSPAPNTAATPFKAAWEGSFLDWGSLSHVNRELTRRLAAHRQGPLALAGAVPAVVPPELAELAGRLEAKAPADAAVTVRHEWPPRWDAPASGAWVLMQPWEYGVLPVEWAAEAARVDEVWAYSHYVRRVYVNSGVAAAKVKVVPLGIDPELFHPGVAPRALATRKTFKFLFVGGTIHRKGPDVLLRAYLERFTAADDVCLVIKDFGGKSVYAGQTFEAQIRAVQARPGAPEILYLNEETAADALPGLYAACQCLAHPYRGEGFGLPVLEAMACGLPVVLTRGGSADDFAGPEYAYPVAAGIKRIGDTLSGRRLVREGWLMEPDPVAFGDRMRWVFEHQDEARAMGAKASAHALSDWTWDRSAAVAEGRLRALAFSSAQGARTRPPRQGAPITLPPCGWVGHLGRARELRNQKKLAEAWTEAVEALRKRPLHPEALLFLAEMALAAGDGESARVCAQRARDVAPGYQPARQFLKGRLKGNTHPAWLALPESLRAGAKQAPRLTVCLIVKNEEKFIDQCLASVAGLADQLVVLDTGSTDSTVERARARGAEIHTFAWCDDFSAARNAAMEHVTGDWVLMLDADEELPPESREALQKLLRAAGVMAWRLPIIDVGREADGCSYVPRLFRNGPGLFFVGRVHEQIFSSIEVRRKEWGLDNRLGDAALRHHGYTKEMTRDRRKVDRNLRLLEKAIEELPDEPSLLMNYGLELVRSGDAARGLAQYRMAFDLMTRQPAECMVPELREMLLTQFCTQLMAGKCFGEIVRVLTSPLAKAAGPTASLHFSLGLAYLEQRQFREAAEQMRHCIAKRGQQALAPVNAEIKKAGPRHCLALCLTRLGDAKGAEAEFREALKDDPASIPAQVDLARFLTAASRPVEGLELLHGTVRQEPRALLAWLTGGEIALSRPEFLDVALDWTAEAERLFPGNEAAGLQQVQALLLAGRAADAQARLRDLPVSAEPGPQALRILCETAAGAALPVVSRELSARVSQEFINLYQRLLSCGAREIVERVNARLEDLSRALPEAARVVQAAVRDAGTPGQG